MPSKAFDRIRKKVKPENKQFVEKNLAICRQIRYILDHHPDMKSQKDLAIAMQKEPSEISKWLTGFHNIGLENLTRMEVALGADIILTDEQAKDKYMRYENTKYRVIKTVYLSEEYHHTTPPKGAFVVTGVIAPNKKSTENKITLYQIAF